MTEMAYLPGQDATTRLSATLGCEGLHRATLNLFKRVASDNRENVETVAVWLHGSMDARGTGL